MRPLHLTYLLFPILYLHSTANLISVSNITQCTNLLDPDCTQKVSVILEIENSQDLTNSTQISANIRNLQLETGEYKTLATQLNITLSKSKVQLYYELSIPTLYNYHAHEILIDTSWLFCDGETYAGDENPSAKSCNQLYTAQKQKVPYSQGFCCSCPWTTTYFGLTSGVSRPDCALFSSSRTGHCMRHDGRWYNGFTVGKNEAVYNVTLTVDS
jgi:hypothetical protein